MKSNQYIVKSNAFIEAPHNFNSIYTTRLLHAALSQIPANTKIDDEARYFVSLTDLEEMTGTSHKNMYCYLREASDQLLKTSLPVRKDAQGEPLQRERKINLVSSCDYYPEEGKVGLRFPTELLPYISNLTGWFTRYKAKYIMPFKRGYSLRIYENCLQWQGTNHEFALEAFKQKLGLGDRYHRIERFRERVLLPALKDINTYSDIILECDTKKTGREVTHLNFTLTKKPGREKPLSRKENIQKNARPGESWEDAEKRLYGRKK